MTPNPVAQAVTAYNLVAERAGLPLCRKITAARRAAIAARIHDASGLDGWLAALDKIEATPWLLGDNDRGWRADIDFIAAKSKFTKLMEGSYDRTNGPDTQPKPPLRGHAATHAAFAEVAAQLERQRAGDDRGAAQAPGLVPTSDDEP